MQEKDKDKVNTDEVITLLLEIKSQNAEQMAKIEVQTQQIEDLEKAATKRGAIAGAVAGSLTGGVMALGIEFIRAKLGL